MGYINKEEKGATSAENHREGGCHHLLQCPAELRDPVVDALLGRPLPSQKRFRRQDNAERQ